MTTTRSVVSTGDRFPSVSCATNGYGLVETSAVFMVGKAHTRNALSTATSTFSLCPGVDNPIEVRPAPNTTAEEVGELWVTGPSVTFGYLGGAEGQSAFVDGWFRTGDVARRLDERKIELVGRRKHLIKRGGKSVSPIEVKDMLNGCHGVKTSVVVGVPYPLRSQTSWRS